MLADIIEYCQERGINDTIVYWKRQWIVTLQFIGLKTEGAKAELIEDLISWVDRNHIKSNKMIIVWFVHV